MTFENLHDWDPKCTIQKEELMGIMERIFKEVACQKLNTKFGGTFFVKRETDKDIEVWQKTGFFSKQKMIHLFIFSQYITWTKKNNIFFKIYYIGQREDIGNYIYGQLLDWICHHFNNAIKEYHDRGSFLAGKVSGYWEVHYEGKGVGGRWTEEKVGTNKF